MKVDIDLLWDGSPGRVDERVSLRIELGTHLVIDVDAPWHGDPPPDGPAGRFWALWEHEVVELFLVGPDERYTEIELGPHGHHLGLQLDGVRNAVNTDVPIGWVVEHQGERWKGRASVSREWLPDPIAAFNAYAIHGVGDRRRYLAHAPVPGDQPDFHRLEHFAPWRSG